MEITIIGTGNMGRAIGYRLVGGGHSVTLVNVNAEKAEKLAVELRGVAKKGALVKSAALASAEMGDVVFLALWYPVTLEMVKQLGSKLANKIVVDIANPLNATYDGLSVAPDTSSSEELAKVAPSTAKIIKAFNTIFASTLVAGQIAGIPLDVFIAGDDEAARKVIAGLVSDSGMVAVDAGQLRYSRQLEGLAMLGIVLQGPNNLGWMSGWKLIHS